MDEIPEAEAASLLANLHLKLVIAESCTGGLISHRITNIPGSSEFFLGSITAYSNFAKEDLLGVRRSTLEKFGAVSRQTVLEMASGAQKVFSSRIPIESIVGVSVTGIAGPGGGRPNKPVGLVWIGLSAQYTFQARRILSHGNRLKIKEHSADAALAFLAEYLKRLMNNHEHK